MLRGASASIFIVDVVIDGYINNLITITSHAIPMPEVDPKTALTLTTSS